MYYAVTIATLVTMGLALIRAVMGPSVYDRVLAVNMFGTKTVLLLSVIAFLYGRPDFLDLALAYALINFIGVLAVLEFFRNRALRRIDEQDKEVDRGTIDLEAWLPYKGDRDQEWLEFQNISIVGDKYTDAFTIKGQKTELWSGCSGIGLERWMVAFLAQKGLDPADWPKAFKRYCPSLPEMPKFL